MEQNPAPNNNKRPDLAVNGQRFDVVAPTSPRARNIVDRMRAKVDAGQTRRIVLVLDDTQVPIAEITSELKLTPILELEQIIVIRNGEARTIWPEQ